MGICPLSNGNSTAELAFAILERALEEIDDVIC